MLGIGPAGPLGRDHPSATIGVAERAGPGGGVSATHGPLVVPGEREALAVLVTVDGLGPAGLGRLLARLGGGAETLRIASEVGGQARIRDALREPDRPRSDGTDLARRIVGTARDRDRVLDLIRAADLALVTLADDAYPARLRSIALPPHVLFVRGDPTSLAADRAVAVVGTRRPTDGGRRLAAGIGAALARTGAIVVSGLAVGVDGAAHAAVVAEGGRTVAVLGGGHNRLYPRAHARLAAAIADGGGAVVSEFAPDVFPTPGTFPRRNRLISGLTEATVVVEAGARSGALTTAAWALEQGRGCFLVPGAIDAPMSAGCLAFLRECSGEARIVAGIPQLLEDLGLVERAAALQRGAGEGRARGRSRPAAPAATAVLASLGIMEQRAAAALVAGLTTVDELVATLDLPVAAVLGVLTLLELRGLVVSAYGRYRPAGPLAGAPLTGWR